MRFLVLFVLLAALVAVTYAALFDDDSVLDSSLSLSDVDGHGHENEGAREVRQFYGYGRGYGRGFGGYGGGYGRGYRRGYGGYGGYRRGYGRFGGGYYG